MALSTTSAARRAGHPGTSRPAARRLMLLAVTLTALMGAGACAAAPEPEVPDPITVTPTIAPNRAVAPEPDVPVVWPLTGVETEEVAARPAVAVKIENTTAARPQSGLESADVVWETVVEFEVSRLIAVFHSQVPEEIGPIRSVRPMDPPITSPLHGLLAFSGGQPGILTLVRNSPVQAISHDAGAPGLYRVSHRSAPHNVYGNLQTFIDSADADHQAPPAEQFAFGLRPSLAGAVRAGTPAATLSFRLSGQARPSWTWDAASGTWLRSEGSSAATDANGNRLSAVNVVAITAPHPPSGYRAQGGASVPTYELVGEGDAVVATGGMTVAGRWSKAANDAPLQLFGTDGSPLLLAPGNTWVELIPAGKGSLTIG